PESRFALVAPLYVTAARAAIERPAGNEQQVRQAVQVAPGRVADRLAAAERHQGPFGAPADRAREVRRSRGAAAPWQDELLERCKLSVPALDMSLERLDLGILEERVPGN